MHTAETYLLHKRSTLPQAIPAGFLVNLLGTIAAFTLTYLLRQIFPLTVTYQTVDPITQGDTLSFLTSAAVSQTGTLAALLLLYFSAFTVAAKWISFFLCGWRGIVLGYAAAVLGDGAVHGLSPAWMAGLSLYFLATVFFLLLASYAGIYNDCILKTFASGARRYTAALTREFTACTFTFSGVVLLCGIASVMLM